MRRRSVGALPVAAACFVILALVFGLGAFTLGFRKEGVPGPGVLPFVTSVALLPIGLRLLLAPRTRPAPRPLELRPLVALAVLALYAAVLPRLGFVAPTVAFVTLWCRAFHATSLGRALAIALLLVAGAVLSFRVLLAVPLPLWAVGP